ncbi:DUF2642 domain-containing protein [Virgibacillus doumboii]|uniref:DUF2642 domain-containing protein n=1 Tax=Virgibacillus doumboii TaxID=2697503 RepID=UPI0013E067AF|nr:DUF2642 domain-containing protein [Virgibacillus doumboii]
MANLTNRQRNLLRMANQFSQNLIDNNTDSNDDNGLESNVSVDLPGVDLNAGVSFDFNGDPDNGPDNGPDEPTTLRELLFELRNEQVQVNTPAGPVSGTLIAVRENYIVLVEDDGSQVFVPVDSIEVISD